MNRFIWLILFSPLWVKGQQPGVLFKQGLSWQEVKERARTENKYIFLDCYATWCGPCREMDNIVYPSVEVSKFANEHFISVKMQIDTTRHDSEIIRRWYKVAHYLKNKYKINTLPTYLFFAPSGRIVHRDGNFKLPDDFLNSLKDAIDSNTQIYTQLAKYRKGERNYQTMPYLAISTYKILNDANMSFVIAEDYNKNYLNKLDLKELYKKENIKFITWWPKVLNSKDKYFKAFYNNGSAIDSVMDEVGFSKKVVDAIITKEEINDFIWVGGSPTKNEPDWDILGSKIRQKYGSDYAERNVLNAQINWYTIKRDWPLAIKFNVAKIERFGLDTTFWGRYSANNMIWSVIFEHCDDTLVLSKAILWMEKVIMGDSNPEPAAALPDIDTYANLLYKIGRKKEAIYWEEKIIEKEGNLSVTSGYVPDKTFTDVLARMKRGERTWGNE